ncbi:MAG: hypothetical protein ACKPBF_07210, partial [Actinomycetota bacterium]
MTQTLMVNVRLREPVLGSLLGVSDAKISPLAGGVNSPRTTSPLATASPRDTIISVTESAMVKLKELRST